jgi:hypothetical protein
MELIGVDLPVRNIVSREDIMDARGRNMGSTGDKKLMILKGKASPSYFRGYLNLEINHQALMISED